MIGCATGLLPQVSGCSLEFQGWFEGLWDVEPFYVRRLKDWNTCACLQHVGMLELVGVMNNMRTSTKGLHGRGCVCNCDVCSNNFTSHCATDCTIFVGLICMWASILCHVPNVGRETCDDDSIGKEESPKFHSLCYSKGECEQCGILNIITFPMEDDWGFVLKMEWKCYQKVQPVKLKASDDNMVLHLVFKETSLAQFLAYLRPRLQKFVYHNFVAKYCVCL